MSVRKKYFTLPKRVIDVPNVGEITMGNANIGVLSDAAEAAKDQPEQQQPLAFANNLIQGMVFKPKMSAEEIEQLTEDQFLPLARCAALLHGMPDLQPFLDTGESSREALNSAATKQQQEFMERMRTMWSLPLTQMNANIQSIVKSAPDVSVLTALSTSPAIQMPKVMDAIHIVSDVGRRHREQTDALMRAVATPPPGIALMSEAIQNLYPRSLGIAEGLLDGISASALVNFKGSLGALDAAANGIIAEHQLVSAEDSESILSRLSSLTGELSSAADSMMLSDTLVPRSLQLIGLDSSTLHTPTYREPEPILIDTWEDQERAREQEKDQRRLRSQDVLFKLERNLRAFVERELSRIVGPRWWRQRVSEAIRSECNRMKAQRERGSGVSNHPIHYTYFGQLCDIILQGDNWREVFSQHFISDNIVRAMFEFVLVVRNDVDHARYSSDSDYTEFMTAANWFHRRIGLDEPFDLTERP